MIDYSVYICEKLKKEETFENIFNVIVDHGKWPALQWSRSKTPGDHAIITFEQMEYISESVADKLIDMLEGCEKTFVGLKADNCPEWTAVYWGILMAGYKPFLLDYRHNLQLTEFFLKQTKAVALITDTVEGFESLNDIVKLININDLMKCDRKEILEIAESGYPGGRFAEEKKGKTAAERLRLYPWGDETALCTSGTTSTAKIFTYNGKSMSAQMESGEFATKANTLVSDDREKRNLAFLPMHHVFGFVAVYLWYSFFRGDLVFPDSKAPSALLAACREHKVTHILAVPVLVNNIVTGVERKVAKEKPFKRFMFRRMMDLSYFAQKISPTGGIKLAKKLFGKSILSNLAGTSLELIICGGGHLLPETMKKINSLGYYTLSGFGMTEVGVCSLEESKSLKTRMKGCVGLPLPSVEYKIVPLNGNDGAGELLIRGESIHSGRVIDGEVVPPDLDEEGWFATGDIGRITEGLYIEGRLKEVIINESGENVYPDEVEDSFMLLDGVLQYTVLGTAKAKSKYEDITLVMQTKNDLNDKAFIEGLVSEIKKRNQGLATFKRVSKALITNDDLPLSNGIKIKRAIIKKEINEGRGNYTRII